MQAGTLDWILEQKNFFKYIYIVGKPGKYE